MVQARKQIWGEVVMVVITLALAGGLLYALLPSITTSEQVLVPPPREMDVAQTWLTLFVAATAIGAPLTAGIVLALIVRYVSKRVPASSTVAPEISAPKPKLKAVEPAKELSAREARLWKVVATLLLLLVTALVLAALTGSFLHLYGL